jgi:hypothetical protein
MASMPPDLDRLGEQLAAAAGRTATERRRRRERRRRVATAGLVGAIAFAVLTPAPLGPAIHSLTHTTLAAAASDVSPGCEYPRGSGYLLQRCIPTPSVMPRRPSYAWR